MSCSREDGAHIANGAYCEGAAAGAPTRSTLANGQLHQDAVRHRATPRGSATATRVRWSHCSPSRGFVNRLPVEQFWATMFHPAVMAMTMAIGCVSRERVMSLSPRPPHRLDSGFPMKRTRRSGVNRRDTIASGRPGSCGFTALEPDHEGSSTNRVERMSAQLGVALVGAGTIGRAHARVSVAHPGLRLVSIVSRTLDSARELARYVAGRTRGRRARGRTTRSRWCSPTRRSMSSSSPRRAARTSRSPRLQSTPASTS